MAPYIRIYIYTIVYIYIIARVARRVLRSSRSSPSLHFVSAKRHFLSSFSKDCNVSFGCSSLLETVGLPRLRKRCHAGWDMDQGFR